MEPLKKSRLFYAVVVCGGTLATMAGAAACSDGTAPKTNPAPTTAPEAGVEDADIPLELPDSSVAMHDGDTHNYATDAHPPGYDGGDVPPEGGWPTTK